jgi:class 3 adenylate cyclase
MPIERKLDAIMFTDIAGYTAQMSKDEDKAFALIQKKRELLLPLIEQYEGKLIKEMGDGKKFLSYPIPKAIVKTWKTFNKDKN